MTEAESKERWTVLGEEGAPEGEGYQRGEGASAVGEGAGEGADDGRFGRSNYMDYHYGGEAMVELSTPSTVGGVLPPTVESVRATTNDRGE